MRISDWSSDVCSSDLPQRAGAAEARELQPRRRMPLGDVAGHVDAAEIEGHALRARPLQRREAVARLFETDPEATRQPVDIVAQRAGGGAEARLGDRKSVVWGTVGSVRVDLGGRRLLKKNTNRNKLRHKNT